MSGGFIRLNLPLLHLGKSGNVIPILKLRVPKVLRRLGLLEPTLPFMFRALQHMRGLDVFFSHALDRTCVEKALPCLFKVTLLGFGYPLKRLPIPNPLKASLSSQHSWASPFRAFFLARDPIAVSSSCAAPAFALENPLSSFQASLQRFPLSHKAGPPYLCFPYPLQARASPRCSPGLSDLSGFSPHLNPKKRLSLLLFPLVLPPPFVSRPYRLQ